MCVCACACCMCVCMGMWCACYVCVWYVYMYMWCRGKECSDLDSSKWPHLQIRNIWTTQLGPRICNKPASIGFLMNTIKEPSFHTEDTGASTNNMGGNPHSTLRTLAPRLEARFPGSLPSSQCRPVHSSQLTRPTCSPSMDPPLLAAEIPWPEVTQV